MIKILFFAQLADFAEVESVQHAYSEGLTPRKLVDQIATEMPTKLIETLRFDATMLSVNKVFADWDEALHDGDEVAFLPPFSGG
jgi:molybdopterin converting factor small subunit